MKELDFLRIINNTLSHNSCLGNDCAYLDAFGAYITQDTLVEDVHFSLKTTNAYDLAQKSVAVNLSDLAANLAIPKYITIGFSAPQSIDENFIEEFYKGINDICNKYNIIVAGGDITKSNKLFISIAAIGKKQTNIFPSREAATPGDIVVTTGYYGSSAAGLYALTNKSYCNESIKKAHLTPTPKLEESKVLAKKISNHIAIMDTSDGFIDAAYKISTQSNVSMEIDIEKIPISNDVKDFAQSTNNNYIEWAFWGGEDYELMFCINRDDYKKLDKLKFKEIGIVIEKQSHPIIIKDKNNKKIEIDKTIFENKSFNHFKEN